MLYSKKTTGVWFAVFGGSIALAAFSAPAMAAPVSCPVASSFVEAVGINDSGVIAGTCVNSSNQTISFTDNQGSYTTLSDPSASAYQTYVTGINNGGVAVGYYLNASGFHGFTEVGGSYKTIDVLNGATIAYGINNSGTVVGQLAESAAFVQGFVDSNGTINYLSDPASPLQTSAFGINDSGDVVGTYTLNAKTYSFFATPTGRADPAYSYITLTDPLAEPGTTAAVGLNNSGEVVGYYTDSSGDLQGFVYDNGSYYTQTGAGANTQAFAINNTGILAGVTYDSPSDVTGFSAPAVVSTAVPEPSTWGLLLLGLGATLGVTRWTWRPKSKAA